jgi:hypothetical protein
VGRAEASRINNESAIQSVSESDERDCSRKGFLRKV